MRFNPLFVSAAFTCILAVQSASYAQADHLFVSNSVNTISELDSSGTLVNTLHNVNAPVSTGLAFDASGNLYAASQNNGTIYKYTGAVDGPGSFAQTPPSAFLKGIVFDSVGNLYVADYNHSVITEFDTGGNLVKSFGNGHVSAPEGIAIDHSGNIYDANYFDNLVQEFDANGNFIRVLGNSPGALSRPVGLAIDSANNLYVANTASNTISVFDPTGVLFKTIGSNLSLAQPSGIAFDSQGNLYAANSGDSTIAEFDSSGALIHTFTSGVSGPQFIVLTPETPEPGAFALLSGLFLSGAVFLKRRRK